MKVLFRARKAGEGFIILYCRITINQVRANADFSTHLKKIPSSDWDSKNQTCSKKHTEHNKELIEIREQLFDIYHQYLKSTGNEPDPNSVKRDFLKKIEIENFTITNVSALFLEQMKNNPHVKAGTKEKHKVHHRKIVKYLGLIKAESLEHHHLDRFYSSLIKQEKHQHNTAIRTIEYLKRVLKNAFEKGYLSFFPCNDYSLKRDRNEKKAYLTKDELQKLVSAKISNENLAQVRDAFVFCCYTGMDYGDYSRFTKKLVKEKDKQKYIDYKRNKSGQRGLVRLFGIAEIIAEKYDYNLPKFVNQNYNKLIKEVCFIAGIDEDKANKISTHSARVTAGMIWLNEGISLEIVSKMLGHASIETTQKYYAEITLDTMLRMTEKLA
ncbi:site-specific integrase [Chondrinema litorale]|uniref:site-specific integrase n=1 Tax=Chondrinema litorale TaxID=2994555 RepID=UPI002543914D|nr:site-specific integrase [Chondrinema litorale]UZR95964.1 site-specific integrase [Chondrinema litorale]